MMKACYNCAKRCPFEVTPYTGTVSGWVPKNFKNCTILLCEVCNSTLEGLVSRLKYAVRP